MSQAMRRFATWATVRPYRLILLTILFVQLIPAVAAGLLVLDALRRGPTAATASALIALAGIGAASLALGASPTAFLATSAPGILGGLASGALLQRTRSLSLSFQATVLGALALSLALFALAPGAAGLGSMLQEWILSSLDGLAGMEEMSTLFASWRPVMFVQLLSLFFFLSVLAGLMLGYWWFALIAESASFGEDFRALRLGRFAGIVLVLLVAAPLFVNTALTQTLAQLAVIGFLFQGLAVMHARNRSDGWHPALVPLVYVTLVSPLSVIAFTGLSIVGLLDNFFALRAPLGPKQ